MMIFPLLLRFLICTLFWAVRCYHAKANWVRRGQSGTLQHCKIHALRIISISPLTVYFAYLVDGMFEQPPSSFLLQQPKAHLFVKSAIFSCQGPHSWSAPLAQRSINERGQARRLNKDTPDAPRSNRRSDKHLVVIISINKPDARLRRICDRWWRRM